MEQQIKKVLVTGADGFIGKNLVATLKEMGVSVYSYDIGSSEDSLATFCSDCDFVFHLAGVNRPKDMAEFEAGNFGFTTTLLRYLKRAGNKCPVAMSSSIQAALNNPYGISKREGELYLTEYGKLEGVTTYVFRLPNVFGKWSRPNYNSAVATFCHNVARDLPIVVNDPSVEMTLVYIDDVVAAFIAATKGIVTQWDGYCKAYPEYNVLLGRVAELIRSFKESRSQLSVPDMADPFTKKLYSTYLSFLPKDGFSYDLEMHVDNRGSFTEFLRTKGCGQVSVNVSKPGITKGNHWHHSKNEKYLVVSGRALIQLRRIGEDDVVEYNVSGEKMQVVDIPTGYTHNIINVGDSELVTVMWVNEPFDKNAPDTYFLEV